MAPTKAKKSAQKKTQMKKKSSSAKTKPAAKTSMKTKTKKTLGKSSTKTKSSKAKTSKVASKKIKAASKSKAPNKNGLALKSKPTKVAAKSAIKKSLAPSVSNKVSSKPKGKAWLRPLDDRLLIEIAEEPKQTPGGIILIDSTEQAENLRGFVIAIGRGHQNKKGRIRPIEAKAGDKVIFSKYAGDKISHDGVNFVVIRETDILGFASN